MRVLVLTAAFLVFPAVAIAQQAVQDVGDVPPPSVELQQTVPASPAAADAEGAEGADVQPVSVEARTGAADAAAQAGDPTTTRWWWLVGAIVVAGIVLAALL
jgi:hypothetical protein